MTERDPSAADPEPRPGTILPRWYADAPHDQQRPSTKQSSVWWLRRPDGSEVTAEVHGAPLGIPQLRTVLQLLFAEPAPDQRGNAQTGGALTEGEMPMLCITWREDGRPVGTASLLEDGRLVLDDGTGPQLARWLSRSQVRDVGAALVAANLPEL